MGELEKVKGAWGYVEGGMGGVSLAIASSARSYGADIFTEKVMWSWGATLFGFSVFWCLQNICLHLYFGHKRRWIRSWLVQMVQQRELY